MHLYNNFVRPYTESHKVKGNNYTLRITEHGGTHHVMSNKYANHILKAPNNLNPSMHVAVQQATNHSSEQ
jgi:hypothetical protein